MTLDNDGTPDVKMDDSTDLMDYARQVGVADTQGQKGGDVGAEPQTPAPEPAAPQPPTFTHPQLAGKSPEEIEAYLRLVENTVQSQSTRLNEMSDQMMAREAAPPQSPEFDKDDFFDRPVEVVRDVVRAEMAQAVAPINTEINNMRSQARVNSAWQVVEQKFADFSQYRPAIESMLAGQGVRPEQVTPQLLESLYYGAYGYFQKSGAAPSAPAAHAPQPSIPQHRPSAAPLPSAAPTVRQLTEEERNLAKHWGMSEDEYRNMQDADIEEVVGGDK